MPLRHARADWMAQQSGGPWFRFERETDGVRLILRNPDHAPCVLSKLPPCVPAVTVETNRFAATLHRLGAPAQRTPGMPRNSTDPDIVFYHDQLSPETISTAELDAWLALGGYRMHQDVFTASHVALDRIYRLHWLRYDVRSLLPHHSHRRLRRRNHSFACTITPLAGIDAAHHELHRKYRASIDFDGAPTIANCLFGDGPEDDNIFQTCCLSVFDGGRLIAGGYFDLGETSAASILHYFDPAYHRHSLGKYLILLTVEYLQASGRVWYYPGYVVQGHPKMDYKLFLGEERAQYFDPGISRWKPFTRELLVEGEEDIETLVVRWLTEAVQTGRFPSHPLLAEFGDEPDRAQVLRDCPRLVGERVTSSPGR